MTETLDVPLCFDRANPAASVRAESQAGRATLDTVQLVEADLGVNDRPQAINAAYLAFGIARGLTAAITDPTVPELHTTGLACDLHMGHDENARRWIIAFHAAQKVAAIFEQREQLT